MRQVSADGESDFSAAAHVPATFFRYQGVGHVINAADIISKSRNVTIQPGYQL